MWKIWVTSLNAFPSILSLRKSASLFPFVFKMPVARHIFLASAVPLGFGVLAIAQEHHDGLVGGPKTLKPSIDGILSAHICLMTLAYLVLFPAGMVCPPIEID